MSSNGATAIARFDKEFEDKARQLEPRRIISFTRLDQIARKPLDPVIEGWVYADTVSTIIGRSGSCKSFLVQSMCASVALGHRWMGRPVKQGAVFYIGGEGIGGIRKRFDGWAAHHDQSLEGVPLYIASGMPAMCDQLNVAAVVEEIYAIADEMFYQAGSVEPRMIVVDTMARAMAGFDENSAADVGRLIAGLDLIRQSWGCNVMLIHHTGHGQDTKTRGRGSSALYAGMDSEMLVVSDGASVTVTSMKEKDWPKPPQLLLKRKVVPVNVDGAVESTLVLEEAAGANGHQHVLQIRAEVEQLQEAGLSVRKIAEKLGLTKATVEHHRKKLRYSEASENSPCDV